MAYNSYFPQYYQPLQNMPYNSLQSASNGLQTSNGGIIWVQGENAAKAYPVASGASVLLMDSEDSVMYIKSTDQSGMPLHLRIFDYSERISPNGEAKKPEMANEMGKYVSRSEFDEFKEEIKRSIKSMEEGEG
jgi:hypothetical protein